VAAQTKDGIEVKTTISVTFGLVAGKEKIEEAAPDRLATLTGARRVKRPYPFDSKSAFQAIYGQATGKEAPVLWTELPAYVAAERFRLLLARQTLDDLFRPTDPQTFLMEDFTKRLTEDVRGEEVLRERGIEIFSVSVGAFDLPQEVMLQRLDSWEAPWQKRAEVALAAGEVRGEVIKQRAQYKAQAEVANVVRAALKAEGDSWTVEDKDRTMRRILGALRHLAGTRNKRIYSGEALRIVSMLDMPQDALRSPEWTRLLEEARETISGAGLTAQPAQTAPPEPEGAGQDQNAPGEEPGGDGPAAGGEAPAGAEHLP
jgi:hypothetical protein